MTPAAPTPPGAAAGHHGAPGTQVAAVVLGAGAATRLGAVKQVLTDESGVPLIRRLANDAWRAGCAPVLVVVGAHADVVLDALAGTTAVPVHNPDWSTGMASSIRAALLALQATECSALVLIAADQPTVHASHLSALVATYYETGGRVVSAYGQSKGIPALWPRADWDALAALDGDRGAKGLLTGVEPSVVLADGALDLDTPDDVARWHATRGTPVPPDDLSTAEPPAPSAQSASPASLPPSAPNAPP